MQQVGFGEQAPRPLWHYGLGLSEAILGTLLSHLSSSNVFAKAISHI